MRLIRDTALVFAYEAGRTLRNPIWVFIGIFQPVVWLLLFAPLLDGITSAQAGIQAGEGIDLFAPGMLILLALFGVFFAGFGLISDLREGVLERLAVTPASRTALAFGRVLRDTAILTVQALILLVVAWLMGLHADLGGMAASLGLVLLIGVMGAALSYALALLVRNEDGFAPLLNFFSQPLMLLSGIFLPMSLAPAWMRTAANANPLYHAVEAARSMFAGDFGDGTVALAFAFTAALGLLTLTWMARSFRKVTA